MTLGRSASDFSPVSSLYSLSSSSNLSPPVTRNSIRRTRKFRSTKGASKARRDLINAEIRKLRALLPIQAEERERLSYVHAMSLICTFIRKSVLLDRGVCLSGGDQEFFPACEDLLNALPGFLVAMTIEGKLLYVSENVSHYLGLSMVEVLQGDTFYSMITNNASKKVMSYLQDENLNTEMSCVCLFRTNTHCCPLLVRLRVFDPQQRLVVAFCSPSLKERDSFTTRHTPDMRFTHVHHSVALHLGYEPMELIGRSWYSIIHPDDLLLSAREHKQLRHCKQVDLVMRVQDKQLNWVWLYIIASRDTHSNIINCNNYIISEVMAVDLRHKLSTVKSSPLFLSPSICQTALLSTKRSTLSSTESERRKNRVSSSLPYSPNSYYSFPEQNIDYIDFMFSSAFCPRNLHWPSPDSTMLIPPSFFNHTEVSVPDNHAELPGSLSDILLYLEDFTSFSATGTEDSEQLNNSENYGWSDRLNSHNPAPCYSEIEQAEITVLAHQISSLANSFNLYCSKHSIHQSGQTSGCNPDAFLLDKEMIDSVNSHCYVVGSDT